MAYRMNFFLHIFGNFVGQALGPFFTIVVYAATAGLPGWTFWQFILFQGTAIFIWSSGEAFIFRAVGITISVIHNGNFDSFLITPFRPLVHIFSRSIDLDELIGVMFGMFLVVLASVKLQQFSVINTILFIILIMLALMFLASVVILMLSLSFKFVKAFGMWSIFEVVEQLASFPLTIYGAAGMFTFSFIIPIGLASFYPAQALLGRLDLVMLLKLAISAFAFLGVALLIWRAAIKSYTSAGG